MSKKDKFHLIGLIFIIGLTVITCLQFSIDWRSGIMSIISFILTVLLISASEIAHEEGEKEKFKRHYNLIDAER